MQPTDRLHALDAVRAIALLLGIVLHAAAGFVQDFPNTTWRDEPNVAAGVLYYLIHMFRMPTFYLIAGFFGRLLLERRGLQAFLQDRGKRIAVPLFLFGPLVVISIGYGGMLGALPHGADYLQRILVVSQEQSALDPNHTSGVIAHLWFLYYLLWFYLLAIVLRALLKLFDPAAWLAATGDRVLAWVMCGPWAPPLVALPLIAWFGLSTGWPEWLGLPAPQSLIPNANATVGYGMAFALGWMLHRQVRLLLQLQRCWPGFLLAALGLSIYCMTLIGTTPRWTGSALQGTDHLLYTTAYFIGMWCWTFGLIGVCVRFLSDVHPRIRYIADASYWMYLMHITTVIMFLVLLRPYPLHWLLKLMVTVGGSLLLLLPGYHVLVRYTWLGAILNGRRHARAHDK